MNKLKKILGSRLAKQPNTSSIPPSIATSGGSESESFFSRRLRSSGFQPKPSEASVLTTSGVSNLQGTVNTPTVESITLAPTVGIPSPPDETVPELQATIATTVPKIADIADISEGEVYTSNAVTQSVFQGAHDVNVADATFNVVGGDQINYAGTPLSTLLYAEGASWDPRLVCLDGTRTALLDDIWRWINEADAVKTKAEIFLLADVAGSGKSAIAHTIAQRSRRHGLLASSFFFNRNIPERRVSQRLFSTITRDLAILTKGIEEHISHSLTKDRSLASASQSRQFDELILEPFSRHRINRPIVIVVDALDEGCDSETIAILRSKVPKLPGTFRIFATTRLREIISGLPKVDHVQTRSIDIHGTANRLDIAVHIKERLRYVSSTKGLSPDWPNPQLVLDFTAKAEGLFLWVSTVTDYLCTITYPKRKLRTLLYERNTGDVRAELKMDELYAEILNDCNWE